MGKIVLFKKFSSTLFIAIAIPLFCYPARPSPIIFFFWLFRQFKFFSLFVSCNLSLPSSFILKTLFMHYNLSKLFLSETVSVRITISSTLFFCLTGKQIIYLCPFFGCMVEMLGNSWIYFYCSYVIQF